MVITREMDYAIRAIHALSDGKRLNTKAICQKENIPMDFTYKILKKLNQNGYVSIERGVSGGYLLTADLTKLTLYDVIYAIDQDFLLSICLADGYDCPNNSNGNVCKVNCELKRIHEALIAQLKTKSFNDILGYCE